MIKIIPVAVLLCAVGCGANHTNDEPVGEVPPGNPAMAKLASSVEVEVRANTVRMVLHVTNPTNQPVTLEFSSAQKYDFAVVGTDGAEVWRWSKDMGFAAALTSETIPAGGSVEFSESWNPGTRKGTWTAVAELTSTNHRLRERTEFTLR
jgi:hypothetical protein